MSIDLKSFNDSRLDELQKQIELERKQRSQTIGQRLADGLIRVEDGYLWIGTGFKISNEYSGYFEKSVKEYIASYLDKELANLKPADDLKWVKRPNGSELLIKDDNVIAFLDGLGLGNYLGLRFDNYLVGLRSIDEIKAEIEQRVRDHFKPKVTRELSIGA